VPREPVHQLDSREESSLRLAELVGSLSLVTDLGMGQPLEHTLRTCLLAVALGEAAELDDDEISTAYYVALLRWIGCTADAHEAAGLFGNEIESRAAFALIDPASPAQMLRFMRRHVGAGSSTPRRARLLVGALAAGKEGPRQAFRAHCEVAQRLAARLGLPDPVERALGHVFERWDGKGFPAGARGSAIVPAARLVVLARDVEVFHRAGGAEAALALVRERSAGAYDPELCRCFLDSGVRLLERLGEEPPWEATLAVEPEPVLAVDDLDGACRAIADFADLKSPYTVGHSHGVAELAEAASWRLGLPRPEVVSIRRAALLHDLGRVGVSNQIWDKPGPLTPSEWERVRIHPYLTERVLSYSPALAPLARLAGMHHERLDGSGYHRGVSAPELDLAARVIAAADVYQALGEDRPHRPRFDAAGAAEELRKEVETGRLDAEAANAVLEASGHRGSPAAPPRPAGLTDREVEVLGQLAHGKSNKEAGLALGISHKTVGHHVQHIYEKLGVSTRAGATLFAAEHGLARD
jgi:HD-GYP domain-containing protein (c-di-GMP phosphodiesterase class II)